MYLIFISNYFNHHQKDLCDELNKLLNGSFAFIEMENMSEERKQLGWDESKENYVINYSKKTDEAIEIIRDAEVAIIGQAPIGIIKRWQSTGKLMFAYCERIFKKNDSFWYTFPRTIKYRYLYANYSKAFLLCAGGYSYSDFLRMRLFKNRAFVWGYFPVHDHYNVDDIIMKKKKGTILWVGRFIDWKHPETVVELARKIKERGINLSITMIGTGIMLEEMRDRIRLQSLESVITIKGPMSPSLVRTEMCNSEILLSTSDRNEGWGAVINEAMSCACVPVACDEIGARTMVDHEKNGFLFKKDDVEYILKVLEELTGDKLADIQKAAYRTIMESWNADIAASRFLEVVKRIEHAQSPWYDEGVCSKPILL